MHHFVCTYQQFIIFHLFLTADTGLGLGPEKGDPAQGTEGEEAAVTVSDVAPETESAQDVSEAELRPHIPPFSLYLCTPWMF